MSLKVINCLLAIAKIIGVFPFTVSRSNYKIGPEGSIPKGLPVPQEEGTSFMATGECTVHLPRSCFWIIWSSVVVFESLAGCYVSFIMPDMNTLFGTSVVLTTASTITLRCGSIITTLLVLHMVCRSPRLGQLVTSLCHNFASARALQPWKPLRDGLFLVFIFTTLASLVTCMIMTIVFSNRIRMIEPSCILNQTVLAFTGLLKAALKFVIVMLLYVMAQMIASLHGNVLSQLQVGSRDGVEQMRKMKESEISNDIRSCEGLKKFYLPSIPKITLSTEEPGRMSINTVRQNLTQPTEATNPLKEILTEGTLKEAYKLLLELHENQRLLNDYFSWLVIMVLLEVVIVTTGVIFFMTSEPESFPEASVPAILFIFENLVIMVLTCSAPDNVLDQVCPVCVCVYGICV